MEQDNHPPTPSDSAPKAPAWKRVLKFVLVRGVFWYAVICLFLMAAQRHLIYHPSRADAIALSDSLLPEGYVDEIAFQTGDGLTLKGWHVLRTGRMCETPEECQQVLDEGGLLVLYFHGNGGDRRGRVSVCQIFTGAGADVFLMDYRGYGENPGSPSEAGLAEDARGLWKYATQERGVPPERIVLFGESLGGGVAVRLAKEVCDAGEVPAGLLLQSTFSSLTDTAGAHYPWLPVRWLLWDRYPSSQQIVDVTCPIFMIHGTRDRIVPMDLGQKLFDAAPAESASRRAKEFVPLEGADHNGILLSHGEEFTQSIERFLADLAPAGSQNPATE